MRKKWLKETSFFGLDCACSAVARQGTNYDQTRPRPALGFQASTNFAAQFATLDALLSAPDPARLARILPRGRRRANLNPELWHRIAEQRLQSEVV